MVRYALHPGVVISKTDGDEHYIGRAKLAELYQLAPNEYCVWDERGSLGRNWEDYIHLYPRYDGDYL